MKRIEKIIVGAALLITVACFLLVSTSTLYASQWIGGIL